MSTTNREKRKRAKMKVRERNRWEWVRFFDRMAESHARLSEDYERRAAALMAAHEEGGS